MPNTGIGMGTLVHMAKQAGWQPERSHIPLNTLGSTISGATTTQEAGTSHLLRAADFSTDVPRRIWLVDNWIPEGCVTGLFGPGGAGKSLLAQQLATVLAATYHKITESSDGVIIAGYAWVGQQAKGATVLAYFCEDDADELHRRQRDINKLLLLQEPQVELCHFYMQSRVGKENLLMTFDNSVGTMTPFFAQIISDIKATNAQVVILDNIAQLFGGNENSRCEVTQFVNLLHRLAVETNITIVALGHPAKGDGSEYSGSTAWDACFRSRLYFGRPKQDAGNHDPNLADTRVLRRSKTNYSRIGDEVQVRWSDGAFEAVSGDMSNMVDRIAKRNTEKQVKEKFLQLLGKITDEGRNMSHSPQAKNYAPKLMANKYHSYSQKQFAEAMEALLDDGIIAANMTIGARGNRSKITGIGRVKKSDDTTVVEEDDRTEMHTSDL